MTVLEPGMLTTVQDLGRPGHASLGVPVGGAADALALRAGNRLVGNADDAAGLECTLLGPTVVFDRDVELAITGAVPRGEAVEVWSRFTQPVEKPLKIGPLASGARSYLCVAGGFDVPPRLGSASTLLSAGFGGYDGRALRKRDRLALGRSSPGALDGRMAMDLREKYRDRTDAWVIRAVDGPHADRFDAGELDRFWTGERVVSNQSNRVGVRLDGSPVAAGSGEMTSEGAMPGGVQVTPSGQLIALGVDHPTTGGYPLIACVASVDVHLLGQVRPGERVRFERVTIEQARAAFLDRERRWSEQAEHA
jgi:antagonist of KipI